jgi:ATP-dependent Lon protease
MTGEVTLQGRVLAIGGLKEKLLAAKQHKMTTVLIPEENKEDFQEIAREVKLDGLEVVMVNNMDQVLERAFSKPPFKEKPIRKAQSTPKKGEKKRISRKK